MRGSITRRGKTSWRLKFDLDRDPSGERRIRYVTVKGLRKDADRELARLLNDASRGVLIDPTRLTIAEHMSSWLACKDNLSPLSRQRYAETISAYINPGLGGVELQKLKPADVQRWLIEMRQGKRGPRAPRTIVHAYRVLHAALQSAVRLDLTTRNVADNVEPPKRDDREVEILKAGDIGAVLDTLKASRLYILWSP
jgi:hypothetical protein